MAYYPKNKIITNQSAATEMTDNDGIKFQYVLLSDKQVYVGYYYILSTGKTYTGKYPGDGINKELIRQNIINTEDTIYNDSKYTSSQSALAPTNQDYINGFFVRYFYKKRNEFIFQELTKTEYDEISNPKNLTYTFYKPFSIKWMLNGLAKDVAEFNQYSIRTTEEKEKVYGLNEFLQMNYLQYYK